MFKSIFGVSVILAAGLFFAVSVQAQEVSEADIRALPGYKSYSTLSSFTKHLKEDPALFKSLSSNGKFSEKILGSTSLQRKIITDIKKSGDSRSVVSSYLGEMNQTGEMTGRAFSKKNDIRSQLEADRQKRRELNQRQISRKDKNNNQPNLRFGGGRAVDPDIAAQQILEQAQGERVSR